MKVLFLDIDGVITSTRTFVANGAYPNELDLNLFDLTAIRLIQVFCKMTNAKIVITSNWKNSFSHAEIGSTLGLPTIGQTPNLPDVRGEEIAAWLDEHDNTVRYAILDDDTDILPHQFPFFVHVNGKEGLSYSAFEQLCLIFDVDPNADAPMRTQGLSINWVERIREI